MNKVLITGANGFIGKACISLLKENGFQIHALSSKKINDSEISWHQINLLDISQIKAIFEEIRPTHLLHCAWVTTHGKYWNDISNFDWIQSSLEMLKQFKLVDGKKVVMLGTCAEYSWEYGYCTESLTPRKSDNLYGVSKNSLYEILDKFCEKENINYSWARLFFVYGPNENPLRLIPSVINSIISGKDANCSHGNQIRDFIHVEDVAKILIKLLLSDFNGAINIGSGQSVTIKEVVYKIADILGRRDLIKLGVIPGNAKEYPCVLANTSILENKLGFKPKYNIDQGLIDTINWWKNNQ